MARKNVFDIGPEAEDGQTAAAHPAAAQSRPLMGLVSQGRQASPVGAISQTLGTINRQVERAKAIEERLASGQAVVEIDPATIDGSFISDRLPGSPEQHAHFVEQIRQHGQLTPILVRPKVGDEGRFEIAYGRRRLEAARTLGRPVRAIVRTLTDEELVIAQGQENSARSDLSFIERALFAVRLEERTFSRDTVMAALDAEKTVVSRLITIATEIPREIIEAIGPAPAIGRRRWEHLRDLLQEAVVKTRAKALVKAKDFGDLSSDDRFESLIGSLKSPKERAKAEPFVAIDGVRIAKVARSDRRVSVAFDSRVTGGFGSFVTERLAGLYGEYRAKDAQK